MGSSAQTEGLAFFSGLIVDLILFMFDRRRSTMTRAVLRLVLALFSRQALAMLDDVPADLAAALEHARSACHALGDDAAVRPKMDAFLNRVEPMLQRSRATRGSKLSMGCLSIPSSCRRITI